jgi:hypothetical protein
MLIRLRREHKTLQRIALKGEDVGVVHEYSGGERKRCVT